MTVVGGTLLGSSEQRLDNFHGFHRGVFVEIVGTGDSARHSHQSYTVVVDQNCGPDHSTVQLWKPAGERKTDSKGVLSVSCLCRLRTFERATFPPGQTPCFQKRNHSALEASCSLNELTLKAPTHQSIASFRDRGPRPAYTSTRSQLFIRICAATVCDTKKRAPVT